MKVDFNQEFKHFLDYSKVFQKWLKQIKASQEYNRVNVEIQHIYCLFARAATEVLLINPQLHGTKKFLDSSFLFLINENNSKEVREFFAENRHNYHILNSSNFIKAIVASYTNEKAPVLGDSDWKGLLSEIILWCECMRSEKSIQKSQIKRKNRNTRNVSINTTAFF
jgi:hypothetical protein